MEVNICLLNCVIHDYKQIKTVSWIYEILTYLIVGVITYLRFRMTTHTYLSLLLQERTKELGPPQKQKVNREIGKQMWKLKNFNNSATSSHDSIPKYAEESHDNYWNYYIIHTEYSMTFWSASQPVSQPANIWLIWK